MAYVNGIPVSLEQMVEKMHLRVIDKPREWSVPIVLDAEDVLENKAARVQRTERTLPRPTMPALRKLPASSSLAKVPHVKPGEQNALNAVTKPAAGEASDLLSLGLVRRGRKPKDGSIPKTDKPKKHKNKAAKFNAAGMTPMVKKANNAKKAKKVKKAKKAMKATATSDVQKNEDAGTTGEKKNNEAGDGKKKNKKKKEEAVDGKKKKNEANDGDKEKKKPKKEDLRTTRNYSMQDLPEDCKPPKGKENKFSWTIECGETQAKIQVLYKRKCFYLTNYADGSEYDSSPRTVGWGNDVAKTWQNVKSWTGFVSVQLD